MPRSPRIYWISIGFVSGSALAFQPKWDPVHAAIILISFAFVVGLLRFNLSIHLFWTLLFCGLGYWNANVGQRPYIAPSSQSVQIQLREALKSSSRWWRYYATIQDQMAFFNEKVLIYIEKGVIQPPVGSTVSTRQKPRLVTPSSIPSSFNYAKYLKHQNISRQVYLQKGDYQLHLGEEMDRFSAARAKENFHKRLQEMRFSQMSRGLILALGLGSRSYLENDLRDQFAQTGLMHLLALSGLHIGFLFLILQWMGQPFLRLPKGKVFRNVGVMASLWAFCGFTGWAASTLRAVLMLSGWQLTQLLHRKTAPLAILASTALVLVAIRPVFIVEIGFQMSFLAVGSILIFAPWATRLGASWPPFFRKIWSWIWVCLAAQIGVAPLSIYHFHQFPGIFLIANLIVFPLFSVYLTSVFGVVAWGHIAEIPTIAVDGFNQLTLLLIELVGKFAEQEAWVFSRLRLSTNELFWIYGILLIVIWLLQQKKWKIGLLFLSLGIGVWKTDLLNPMGPPRGIWMGTTQATYWAIQKGSHLDVWHDPTHQLNVSQKDELYFTHGIETLGYHALSALIISPKIKIHRQNHNEIPQSYPFPIEVLWISQGPRLDFDPLLDSICPQEVWIDKTNPVWLSRYWKRSCLERQLQVFDMRQTGYRIIPL